MRIRHYARKKFYTIGYPESSTVVCCPEQPSDGIVAFHDHLIVPLNGTVIRIPADPPELLPMLAEAGNFGASPVGEPEPGERLRGIACPDCGEADVAWLRLREDETVRCDRCGAGFGVPVPTIDSLAITERSGD